MCDLLKEVIKVTQNSLKNSLVYMYLEIRNLRSNPYR